MPELTTTSMSPLAFSVASAAERVDCSKSYLWNEVRAGNLRTVRKGRRRLVLEEDLRSWLNDTEDESDQKN